MFYGEYRHMIDEKGRIIMPVKYRQALGARLFITKDLWAKDKEKCLFVYSEEGFNALADKLRRLRNSEDEIRMHNRRFFPSVEDTEADAQGRVLINQELREYAGLSRDIVLAGLDDHIEIWDAASWAAYNESSTDLYSTGRLAESFIENGL